MEFDDLVREAASVGENIDVWVEARAVIGEAEPITIRRQLQLRKAAPGDWVIEGPHLLFKKTDSEREKFQVDGDGSLQSKIDADIPEDLFSWFHFAGEPAEGKMSHGNGRTLMELLKMAIQLRRWVRAVSTAEGVAASLKDKLRKESRNHGAYAGLLHRKDVVARNKANNERKLTQAAVDLSESRGRYSEVDSLCHSVSAKAAESQQLYQRLKELRDANLLPADILKGFIERLMKSSNCVCGRCMDESALGELEAYMTRTLASRTNNDLTNLANALEGGDHSPVRKLIESYPGRLNAAVGKKADAARALAEAETAVADLRPEVENSSIDEFKRLIRERDRLGREVKAKEDAVRDLEAKVRQQEESLRGLNAELTKARPKRGAGEIEKLEAAVAIADQLVKNLTDGQRHFQDTVYSLLQERRGMSLEKRPSDWPKSKAAMSPKSLKAPEPSRRIGSSRVAQREWSSSISATTSFRSADSEGGVSVSRLPLASGRACRTGRACCRHNARALHVGLWEGRDCGSKARRSAPLQGAVAEMR